MQSLLQFRKPPSNHTMGIELECLVHNDWWYGDKNVSKYHGFFYATGDGSIQTPWNHYGAEFVSQPLTRQWLKKELIKLSNKVTWAVNDSCGIHIHISRKWLSERKARALYTWMNTLSFADLHLLFGRKGNDHCRYNRQYGDSRYLAINNQNKATIEFRMFASGDVKWAQYCVDMADYLVRNANHINVEAARAFHDLYYKD